jgi:hypothetical protein
MIPNTTHLPIPVLSSGLIHLLTVYKLPKWAEKDIDHFRRSFLSEGIPKKLRDDIAWSNGGFVLSPRSGGHGIMDLERFRRALRLHWLWNC